MKKIRAEFLFSFNLSKENPVIKVIYAGIKGKTHGLINVNIPAKKLAKTGKLPSSCITVLSPAFFLLEDKL